MDPDYTLRQFFDDLAVFPELNLYLVDMVVSNNDGSITKLPSDRRETTSLISSGRTVGDEYQRTVGSFFALFWLMRLHIDGKDSFSFGVDEDWFPLTKDSPELQDAGKRTKFRFENRWSGLRRLLVDARLITVGEHGNPKV